MYVVGDRYLCAPPWFDADPARPEDGAERGVPSRHLMRLTHAAAAATAAAVDADGSAPLGLFAGPVSSNGPPSPPSPSGRRAAANLQGRLQVCSVDAHADPTRLGFRAAFATDPTSAQLVPSSAAGSVAAFAAEPLACAFVGDIDNAAELRALYGLPEETGSGADLILALHLKGWQDTYGDCSDQPATGLASMTGKWSFVLADAAQGYLLAARSPGDEAPEMMWGTAQDGALVFSTDAAALRAVATPATLTPFPRGCLYQASATEEAGSVTRFSAHGAQSGSSGRGVCVVLRRTDSRGDVCGLGFHTQSGTDLVSLVAPAC